MPKNLSDKISELEKKLEELKNLKKEEDNNLKQAIDTRSKDIDYHHIKRKYEFEDYYYGDSFNKDKKIISIIFLAATLLFIIKEIYYFGTRQENPVFLVGGFVLYIYMFMDILKTLFIKRTREHENNYLVVLIPFMMFIISTGYILDFPSSIAVLIMEIIFDILLILLFYLNNKFKRKYIFVRCSNASFDFIYNEMNYHYYSLDYMKKYNYDIKKHRTILGDITK